MLAAIWLVTTWNRQSAASVDAPVRPRRQRRRVSPQHCSFTRATGTLEARFGHEQTSGLKRTEQSGLGRASLPLSQDKAQSGASASPSTTARSAPSLKDVGFGDVGVSAGEGPANSAPDSCLRCSWPSFPEAPTMQTILVRVTSHAPRTTTASIPRTNHQGPSSMAARTIEPVATSKSPAVSNANRRR